MSLDWTNRIVGELRSVRHSGEPGWQVDSVPWLLRMSRQEGALQDLGPVSGLGPDLLQLEGLQAVATWLLGWDAHRMEGRWTPRVPVESLDGLGKIPQEWVLPCLHWLRRVYLEDPLHGWEAGLVGVFLAGSRWVEMPGGEAAMGWMERESRLGWRMRTGEAWLSPPLNSYQIYASLPTFRRMGWQPGASWVLGSLAPKGDGGR